MAFSAPKLSELQAATLRAFFARERAFFLTGGAALAGFHLGHRSTDDLDLFTTDDIAFERGRHVLEDIAATMGGSLEIRVQAPRFLRAVLTRSDEALVIDLVRDLNYQRHETKQVIDEIVIDPPDEILANKLTTLVARAEERDLIDVMFLERSGLRIEDALPVALAKDGGCTPATLAWLLSQVSIPDDIALPGGVTSGELRDYVNELVERFRRLALPATGP